MDTVLAKVCGPSVCHPSVCPSLFVKHDGVDTCSLNALLMSDCTEYKRIISINNESKLYYNKYAHLVYAIYIFKQEQVQVLQLVVYSISMGQVPVMVARVGLKAPPTLLAPPTIPSALLTSLVVEVVQGLIAQVRGRGQRG